MSTFKLPDLGEGLAEAEIIEWHVRPGDRVSVDQPMVSVETAKSVVELPMPYGGVVARLHAAAGDIVPTGAALIDVDTDAGTVVGSMPATSDEEFVENVTLGGNPGPAAPRGRAVPVARALAKRLGVDLGAVVGTGHAGLITLDDVLQHARVPAAAPAMAKMAAHPRRCAACAEPWRIRCRSRGIKSPWRPSATMPTSTPGARRVGTCCG